MARKLKTLIKKVASLENVVSSLSKENESLRQSCLELDEYKRIWNLRVAGVPESNNENVKNVILEIFGNVSPESAASLANSVDIVHRLGPKSATDRSRLIIVQFTSRSVRDKIWKDAKSSDYLRRNNYRVLEDLSLNMKEERNKLWPLVNQARDEGKRAGFRGAFAYVEGKKI